MPSTKSEQVILLIPLFFAVALTASLFVVYKAPIGVDVYFHLKIAEAWARGENGMYAPIALAVNRMPYSPLLHWILVPAVLIHSEIFYTAYLQIFFLPLAVGCSMFLVYKMFGKEAALFEGLLLLGSFAFVDRAMQINPQALDFMLMPIAIFGFIKNKEVVFALACLGLIWSHGIVGLAAIGGLLILQILRLRNNAESQVVIGFTKLRQVLWSEASVILCLALSAPIVIAQLWYLPQTFTRMNTGFETLQEAQFWANPLLFTVLYQRLIVAGIPIALLVLFRHFKKAQPLDDITKAALVMLGSLALILPVWADRFVQYSTIPLSLLIIAQFVKSKPVQKEAWKFAIFFLFLMFYITLWLWLFTGTYQVGTA